MRIIDEYSFDIDSTTGYLIVISTITHYCNICYQKLIKNGRRRRRHIAIDLKRYIVIINRLLCKNCKKYHNELPSCFLPHKLFHIDIVERCGQESSGLESSGLESPGLDSSGLESSGLESSGLESPGLESSDPKPSNLEPCTGQEKQSDGAGAMEITTVHRLRRWLAKVIAVLPRLIAQRKERWRFPDDDIESTFIGRRPGWLAKIVQDLTFHGLWPSAWND
jgi:hypothetical protein